MGLSTAKTINWQKLIEDLKLSISHANLVFIDGGPRTLVAKLCSETKIQTQLVILDNSDRQYERIAAQILSSEGYTEIPFSGLGPLNPYSWTTSFFVRELETFKNLMDAKVE